ncbi:MAG: ABC transporter ATP-binding protein [Planctomycetes bacterium]|nr:ABC transporter ATP-binding protein [Planctomycetota bacterium]
MHAFWRLTKELLHERYVLVGAMIFAFVSAAGLGVGLLAILPIMKVVIADENRKSMADMANEYNAGEPLVAIPATVVGWLPTDPFMGVALIIALMIVLTAVGAMANFLHAFLTGTVAAKTVARIRQQAFERAVHMPLGRVVERGPTEFVARIVRDAAEIQRGFIALTSKAVAHLTKAAAALFLALYVQWELTLVAIPTALVVAAIVRKFGKHIRRGARGSLQAQEGLLRVSTEVLQGLRAVKASTGEPEASRRFSKINDEVVHHELKIRTARAVASPLLESLMVVVLAGLALLAAKLILENVLEFERFMFVMLALGITASSFRPLAGLVNEVQASAAPAVRLCEILDEDIEEDPSVERPALPRHTRSIEVDAVTFSYPGADEPALRDISLLIEHGARVAIVGPNGSGKTTLASLIPRLLVPRAGRVAVDGVDIASVTLESLRRQIGVVTQETVLFRGSIAANLAFGMEHAERSAIIDAAKRARADEFISALPDGYDADIAEQGASLSGGQRQRLAIARAILRDPAILILDEATSQIDASSEEQINATLAEFCRGRTTVIVAHRLATVLNADWIVVMDEGRIVDRGTHDELLERCTLYQELTRTQLVTAR